MESARRLRDFGLAPGSLPIGPLNAITDVPGVRVGQVTVIEGERLRTGATAIVPHDGNLCRDKLPAGLAVFNGFGKFAGATQVQELGEIETPIVLTNTLAVGRAIEAINRVEVFRFIVKPWENSQLVELVTDALKRYRLIKSIVRGDEGRTWKGSIATSIAKVFDLTVASTGASEKALAKAGT